MMGAFGTAALDLHAHGLAVIPTGGDDGKRPLVGGWNKWRGQQRQTVEAFARRYSDANLGIVVGLSGLTVVDCDDERTLADAAGRFGDSPLVTRSPRGGGHLWYRSSGERCANLRRFGLNIDVKGHGGYVVAPPSAKPGGGLYRIERGTWDDLRALPAITVGAIPERQATTATTAKDASEGQRNNTLFATLRSLAVAAESPAALAAQAHGINATYAPPLPIAEVERVVRSVWKLKNEGRLFRDGQPARVLMQAEEMERLDPDSFYLLAWVRRWHSASEKGCFCLSSRAMARDNVLQGWGRMRYRKAIDRLCASGDLRLRHQGGRRKGDASQYSLGARNGPNVTRHPSRAFPEDKETQAKKGEIVLSGSSVPLVTLAVPCS